MLEQITLHLRELSKSPFFDPSTYGYVVIFTRQHEDDEGDEPHRVDFATGVETLGHQLQAANDAGYIGGDHQIVGRYRQGHETFDHVPPPKEGEQVVVGITESCTRLRAFPATRDGYNAAVEFIGTLENHEQGIYYLDAPEGLND